ncbi:MAG: hypothetical protein QOI66_3847 [Myxococcales bacterium]|jgi:hypothetical protein|nr:hypothetical protein [Myxococcales bacterium]
MSQFKGVRWGLVASTIWLLAGACGSNDSPKGMTTGTGGSASGSGGGSDTNSGSGGAGGAGATTGTGGAAATGSGGASSGSGGSATGSGGAGGGAPVDAGSGGTTGTGGSSGTGGAVKPDGGPGDLGGGTGGASGDAGNGSSCPATGLSGAGVVKVAKNGATFALTRDGAAYYIKGIAGGANLALAQQYGVNSTRTFGSDGAMGILDGAKSHCMTVLLGIELSKDPNDYANAGYTAGKRAEVTSLLSTIKNHPALLMWALGNETNLGADTQPAWAFIGQLAQLIHQQDPNHPVITVFAGANVTSINNMVQWSQGIDAIGINSYAAVVNTNSDVARSTFTGPVSSPSGGPPATGNHRTPAGPGPSKRPAAPSRASTRFVTKASPTRAASWAITSSCGARRSNERRPGTGCFWRTTAIWA